MNRLLLAAAAPLAALALPAGAQSFAPGATPAVEPGLSGLSSVDRDFGVSVHRDGKRHDRRRHRDRRGIDTVLVGSPYAWALYNNRNFDSDSFNDWWHDRPDRAYPRWMQHNQNCERMWWGGGAWRC